MEQAQREQRLEELEKLASWMDDRFRIPGTSIRFGLDSIVGLVPGVGDTVTLGAGVYMIWRAAALDLPAGLLARIMLNTGIDWVVGLVPIVGDLADLGFKAHRRNARLLRQHMASVG
ncbi:MAG: DUF4112 domain-containing protein [Alphaproteobacteria bacterium]